MFESRQIDKEAQVRSCEWCGTATTVMGRRFGTMCELCYQIESNITVGIATWREARAQKIAEILRAALLRHTIYEHDEIRIALEQIESEWAEGWFKELIRLSSK